MSPWATGKRERWWWWTRWAAASRRSWRSSSVVLCLHHLGQPHMRARGGRAGHRLTDGGDERARRLQCLEIQLHDDVQRVIHRAHDAVTPYPGRGASDRIAVEGRLPLVERLDGVLDDQAVHRIS